MANIKIILSINRNSLKISRSDVKNLNAETIFESPFTVSDFQTIISANRKYLGKPFRILLDDSISYTLVIKDLPIEIPDERTFIAQKVREQIPDFLDNNDWDFKETDRTKEAKSVTVFAPIKEYADLIRSAIVSLKLSVEAMEPASIASLLHQNPVIGLALKSDLSGPDDKVLNLSITSSRPVRKISPLLIIPLIAIITALIFFTKFNTPRQKPIVIPTITPTLTPTLAPSPTSAPFDRTAIKIQVLNGSGSPGVAKKIARELTTLGYQNIETGNANNSNYPKTIVKILSTNFHDQYLADLKDILIITNDSISVDNTQASDVIVILGKN